MPYRKLGTIAVEGSNPVSLYVLQINERSEYSLLDPLMSSFGITYEQIWTPNGLIERLNIDENKTLIYIIYNGPDNGCLPLAYAVSNPEKEGYSKIEWIQTNPNLKGKGFGQLLLTHTIFENLRLEGIHQVRLENAADDLKKGEHIYGKKMSYNFLVFSQDLIDGKSNLPSRYCFLF